MGGPDAGPAGTAGATTSARLAALCRELATGDNDALARFWGEIAAHGTPLIEPIAGDDEHVLVTFLWRGERGHADQPPPTAVIVMSGFGGWDDFGDNRMELLPNTDVWFKTYRARADDRSIYAFGPDHPFALGQPIAGWKERLAARRPDPLNPHRLAQPPDPELSEAHPRHWGEALSVAALPKAPAQPWIAPRPDVPAGELSLHRLPSARLGYDRRVWLYTPPGHAERRTATGPHRLLVLFDGFEYAHYVPVPRVLDNLLAADRLPPHVAVLVDSPEGKRGELGCSAPFLDFLADELMPWVRDRYAVTRNPAETIVGGSSLGGLAAMFAALRRPDLFGKVLSQSGAFQWAVAPDPEPEWLTRQIAATTRVPVRAYLEVGLRESHGTPSLLVANRHLRDVLLARDYSVRYAEYMGGHDWACWRGSLADGLLALAEPVGAEL